MNQYTKRHANRSVSLDVQANIAELNGTIAQQAAENERLRAALRKAREYVVKVDGTMAFIPPENRVTRPDLDMIDAALGYEQNQPGATDAG